MKPLDNSDIICYNKHQRHSIMGRSYATIAASYKKLWKLLIDKDMKKKDLQSLAGISNYTISKLNRGENVTVDILERICEALNCTANDILDFTEPSNTNRIAKGVGEK